MATIGSIGSAIVQGRRRSLEQYGDQLLFYVKALAWAPRAVKRYPREILNTLAEITFGAGGPPASATYLARDDAPQTPVALVTTDRGADGDHAEVHLYSGLSRLSRSGCYPRDGQALVDGSPWGGRPLDLQLPLIPDAQGHPTLHVALDLVLGIGQGTHGNAPAFRWASTTTPAGSCPATTSW